MLSCNYAIAQKIPSVQNTGYFAPQNIKVDGIVNDWGNQFQANNKHNSIRYTIANNQTNLYFVVQTADLATIKKITANGISLIITAEKKQLNHALTVTFPSFTKDGYHLGYLINNITPDLTDALDRQYFFDSVMNETNQKIERNFKFIGITGIKTISDSLISVYNLDGIKAAARMDNKLAYNYELAIPLNYLKDQLKSDNFSYDIRINGVDVRENLEIIHRKSNPNDLILYKAGKITYMVGKVGDPWSMMIAYSTDFWGEYNIISK